MVFPTLSSQDYAIMKNAIKNALNAFTVCFFVKSSPHASGEQTVYSYAISSSTNEIYIVLLPKIGICVNGEGRYYSTVKLYLYSLELATRLKRLVLN